jgi:hypothetical protein
MLIRYLHWLARSLSADFASVSVQIGDNLKVYDAGDLFARLCRTAGGEPEQIQFLLDHLSIQTAQRDLGCA